MKVVQRVPLRFCFNPDQKTEGLRAGMSATIDIDTGRSRSLAQLVLGPIDWLKSWFVSPPAAASAS